MSHEPCNTILHALYSIYNLSHNDTKIILKFISDSPMSILSKRHTNRKELKMKYFDKALVFSVYNSSRPLVENIDQHTALIDDLTNSRIPYVELLGSYKGVQERSILISNADKYIYLVEQLCKLHGQESYLSLDVDRHAELVYLSDSRRESIGYITAVSETEAKSKDAWSYNPIVKQYYITAGA